MPSLTGTARRVLAIAAVSGAAVTVAAATVTGAGAASRAPAAPAPECATSALQVWIGQGPGEAAAGSTYYPLEFSNVSHRTCDLFGFPGVSAQTSGAQVGHAAARDHRFAPATVVLAPGQTAHALLQVTDVSVLGNCKAVGAGGLRIYPPDRTAS